MRSAFLAKLSLETFRPKHFSQTRSARDAQEARQTSPPASTPQIRMAPACRQQSPWQTMRYSRATARGQTDPPLRSIPASMCRCTTLAIRHWHQQSKFAGLRKRKRNRLTGPLRRYAIGVSGSRSGEHSIAEKLRGNGESGSDPHDRLSKGRTRSASRSSEVVP